MPTRKTSNKMSAIPADDPFAEFLRPPPGETPDARAAREDREAEAKRVSDRIDEQLKMEKSALKKRRGQHVKILLLGQSESGKSTTLKNFQMRYAPASWKQERMSWRAVIQLNLVRCINTIINALQAEISGIPPFEPDGGTQLTTAVSKLQFTEKHQILKLRLAPLRRVELDLRQRLGAGADEEISVMSPAFALHQTKHELCVRSWKHVLDKNQGTTVNVKMAHDLNDAAEVIASCAEDMKSLWEDETVRRVLYKRKVKLGDSADFYLNDLERIASRSYEPLDSDVLRARLRTLGVQEHRLRFEQGVDNGHEWTIYDVGGTRSARTAWLPYFDNVNAIIFLAPISAFDEGLAEDPRVNRLRDSFLLWRAICSSELLQNTVLIIFLNKCDLLEKKLKAGIKVSKFVPSFGDRPNDRDTVVKYLSKKFQATFRESSQVSRPFYLYPTSVTDTDAMSGTLSSVHDGIIREYLKKADFV